MILQSVTTYISSNPKSKISFHLGGFIDKLCACNGFPFVRYIKLLLNIILFSTSVIYMTFKGLLFEFKKLSCTFRHISNALMTSSSDQKTDTRNGFFQICKKVIVR